MKGSRPKQSELTKGNDLSKTEETSNVKYLFLANTLGIVFFA